MAIFVERIGPCRFDAFDLRLGRVAQIRRRYGSRKFHRQLFAHIDKARMHLGRIGPRQRARFGIVGQKLGFGMTVGQRLADREAVPHEIALALLFDLEHRHASGAGALLHLCARGVAAEWNDVFLEGHADVPKRHIGPEAPARPFLGPDDQRVGHERLRLRKSGLTSKFAGLVTQRIPACIPPSSDVQNTQCRFMR
jgi:hypothetical protein